MIVLFGSTFDASTNSSSSKAPNKVRLFLYWVCIFLAKGVSESWMIPWRQSLLVALTKASSTFLGRPSVADCYIGCTRLAKAIEIDDSDEVLSVINLYPSTLSTPWMGITPINHAISLSSLKAASVLLDYGGFNPSFALESCKNIQSVEFLLKRGAKVEIPNPDGRRCVDVAALNGLFDVAEMMIRSGGCPSPSCLTFIRNQGKFDAVARLMDLVSTMRKEKRMFANLVLVRSCSPLYSTELIRELIFELADLR